MDMGWTDFEAAVAAVMIAEVGEWCAVCQSPSLFCAAYNKMAGSVGGGRA